jgi:histidinol-phosphate/aromatic aminotransferase/cobyric acid decarboxylase-like protein
MSRVLDLARPEIVALSPYSAARWDPALVRLHANENPWRSTADVTRAGLNRYPEPQSSELVEALATLYGVAPDQVLAGRGSDEGIDLLVRAFCRAGRDNIVVCPPTFGMYRFAADVQGAAVIEVPLRAAEGFSLDPDADQEEEKPEQEFLYTYRLWCLDSGLPTVSMMSETTLPLNLVYNSERERCPCHTNRSFNPVAMASTRPL